jgi:mRNA interferase MazF
MWEIVVIKRGDIFYADLSPVIGSEQGGIRPVLIVQNDIGNKYSPTVIAAAITSQINKAKLPTHIELDAKEYGLQKDSVVLLEQIRTIDKRRLREKIGRLDDELMKKVNEALSISFGLTDV